MDSSEGLIQQLAQQAGEERTQPAKVLKDVEDEKKEYEKDLLQGAGGLLAGNTVEKAFKILGKGEKGKAVLKRLGMSDEDVDTVVGAIRSRDSGALTDFLARKGTGYAENIAKQLGQKGTKVVRTTAKALKERRVPTREEISDSLRDGGGSEVNPTASNRSGQILRDADAEGVDSQEGSLFDSLISRGRTALKSTAESLENTIGDVPSTLSAQASRITADARGVVRGAESSVRNSLSKTNSAFERARAEFQGAEDLEGQQEAVKKLLQQSKAGRRLIRKNAKARAEGRSPEKERTRRQRTEFDEEDADGDLLTELANRAKAPKGVRPDADELPNEPVEIDAITGRPALSPDERVAQARAKIDADAQAESDRIAELGNRDPYQDIYDEADRVAQRFTPKELGVGRPIPKTEVDFRYRAPTESEHKAQLKAQEQRDEPMLKTDETDPDLAGAWEGDEDVARVVEKEAPREAVPPSQQTEGLDPSKLPDDASYQRGSQRIQAKKEVDPPQEPEQVEKSDLDNITEEEASSLFEPVKEPAPTPQQEPARLPVEEQQVRAEAEQPRPPEPQPEQQSLRDATEEQSQQEQEAKTQQANEEIEEQARNPASKPKDDLNPDEELDTEGATKALTKGDEIESGITKAFESSLAEDETGAGIILTGLLGIGSLVGGFLTKSHHPTFAQPPALHPYESFSVQEGVA